MILGNSWSDLKILGVLGKVGVLEISFGLTMKFLFSLILLPILIFSLSCKTTTQDQSSVSLSEQQSEEPKEKPQSIVIPVSSLGDVSETRQQILQNSLEDELKEHFTHYTKIVIINYSKLN